VIKLKRKAGKMMRKRVFVLIAIIYAICIYLRTLFPGFESEEIQIHKNSEK
jgi:hypothetical protein